MVAIKEDIRFSSGSVDREAGIIRDVKILGQESDNDRFYSDKAMEQACKAYEGIGVNIGHEYDINNRNFRDGFGWLENTRIKDSGVWGDLHFLKTHELADTICEAAERNPSQLGLSHDANGLITPRGNGVIVESLHKINSVDLVRSPATNKGLFEETIMTDPKRTRLQEISDELALAPEAPTADPPAGEAAFAKEIMSILANPEFTKQDKLKRIRGILDAQEKLAAAMAAPQAPTASVTPAEVPVAEERMRKLEADNKRILEEIESNGKKQSVREKLSQYVDPVVVDDVLVDSLSLLEEKVQDKIIESLAVKPSGFDSALQRPHTSFNAHNDDKSSYDDVIRDTGLSLLTK